MKIPHAAAAAVITLAGLVTASITASLAGPASLSAPNAREGSIAHGRYLVAITGCNDCHTPGYSQTGGQAPMEAWLTGVPVGYQGPWGTSYPANLRLTVQSLTEDQWLVFARAEKRPPMPWFSLTHMSDQDLRDMYRFIRSLGPAGVPAPAAVLPGGKVNTPFIVLEPRNLGGPNVKQPAKANPPVAGAPAAMPEVVVYATRPAQRHATTSVTLAQADTRAGLQLGQNRPHGRTE